MLRTTRAIERAACAASRAGIFQPTLAPTVSLSRCGTRGGVATIGVTVVVAHRGLQNSANVYGSAAFIVSYLLRVRNFRDSENNNYRRDTHCDGKHGRSVRAPGHDLRQISIRPDRESVFLVFNVRVIAVRRVHCVSNSVVLQVGGSSRGTTPTWHPHRRHRYISVRITLVLDNNLSTMPCCL